jgi:hypothetical protein
MGGSPVCKKRINRNMESLFHVGNIAKLKDFGGQIFFDEQIDPFGSHVQVIFLNRIVKGKK